MLNAISLSALAHRFAVPGTRAVALLGSRARGDAEPFSDVDLVRFTDGAAALPASGSHLIDDTLVVVSDVAPEQTEAWFTAPEQAVAVIAGLRAGQALIDADGVFAALQVRAQAFAWDDALQQRADHWAGAQLAGWAEEARKGLEGLRRDDTGRLLQARHGLSWGLARVLRVHLGVLQAGDNDVLDSLAARLGDDADDLRLARAAFGIEPLPLRTQVTAGLRWYAAIAARLDAVLMPDDSAVIRATAEAIREALGA